MGEPRGSRETVVAESAVALRALFFVFPVLGAGLIWLLKAAAEWVASLAWAPFHGLFKLIASIPEPQATLGALGIGALLGLVIAYGARQESLAVTVSADLVVLERGGSRKEVERAAVADVFLDGKKLVLLDANGAELAREDNDLNGDRLRDAFIGHEYRWRADGDPYGDQFRRWVEDMPGLPPAANALLKARAKALRHDHGGDAAELRDELARLGVVVRDERKRQYYRLLPGSG